MNSETFCVAPWLQACINPDGKLTPCCQWTGKSQYTFDQIEQWHESSELKNARHSLLDGNKINECNRCWRDESTGKRSLRKIYNKEFAKYLDLENPKVVTFDFKLGNLCNLKCVMCDGNTSSQLLTEYKSNQKQFNNIKGYVPPAVDVDFEWPLSQKFKDFLDKFKNQARWIKFTGGEPTIIPYVIDLLDEIPNPELVTISLTTNATKINYQLLDALSKFQAVWINVSIEGIGHNNDQIRYLSNWSVIEENIMLIKQLPNVFFNISYVLQCFSVTTMIPLLKWCDQHNFQIENIILDWPKYLTINSVNAEAVNAFRQNLTNLQLKNNRHVVDQTLEVLNNYTFDWELKKQRLEYFKTLDNIRGTDLQNLID